MDEYNKIYLFVYGQTRSS